VRFNGQGAPAETTFTHLTDWSKHDDQAIRHYSGTAVYQTRFDLTEMPVHQDITLSLGDSRRHRQGRRQWQRSRHRLERAVGSRHRPALKPGENTLEIHVTNTWNNRLVADAALPAAERQTTISEGNLFTTKDPLLKSGLIGPVNIRIQNP
jgi:hypothetical protein